MIELQQLSLTAGTFSLQNVSLTIPNGQYGVLMGRTGSGKTSLLEVIAGLRRPQQGRVLLHGVDVTTWDPADRGIGYVPQDRVLFPTMTVAEHLWFAVRLGRSPTKPQAFIAALADQLQLTALLDRPVTHLSGGEAQRVALGRALSIQPRVLLLDEPLSAVDDTTHRDLMQLLKTVQQTHGVTTLHVTHRHDEATTLADCSYHLINGTISHEFRTNSVLFS
jgi:ABC-type sugar transport system ATPase subunit